MEPGVHRYYLKYDDLTIKEAGVELGKDAIDFNEDIKKIVGLTFYGYGPDSMWQSGFTGCCYIDAPAFFVGKEEEPQDGYQARWYPHNTLCVAGIEFRSAKPETTNKWYNFVALDLSNDGVNTYDLVASNMYVVGTVTVTKNNDELLIDWRINQQGTSDANFQLEDEFMTIFSSLNAVTELEPENFEGPTYAFGQPISIQNDLGGDTSVLLYIRNVATYCDNLSYKHLNPIYHPRYSPDESPRVHLRQAMQSIMDADTME